jgi:hypothetical protein
VAAALEHGPDRRQRLRPDPRVKARDQGDDLVPRALEVGQHRALLGDRPRLGRTFGHELRQQLRLFQPESIEVRRLSRELYPEVRDPIRQIDIGQSHGLPVHEEITEVADRGRTEELAKHRCLHAPRALHEEASGHRVELHLQLPRVGGRDDQLVFRRRELRVDPRDPARHVRDPSVQPRHPILEGARLRLLGDDPFRQSTQSVVGGIEPRPRRRGRPARRRRHEREHQAAGRECAADPSSGGGSVSE